MFHFGGKCGRFASKICDKFSEIFLKCVLENFGITAGIFMTPLRIFRIATFFAKIRENYTVRNIKTFDISSSKIFHNFLYYIVKKYSMCNCVCYSRSGVLNLFCLVYPLPNKKNEIYPHFVGGPQISSSFAVISKKRSPIRRTTKFYDH